MAPPFSYIVVAMMLISATLSAIFFLAWKTLGKKPYALTWSGGCLAATFLWIFTINFHRFPNDETYWLTVSAFALVLITLGLRGHCQRTACKTLPENLWPLAGIIYAGIVWSSVGSPHVGISMALIPASTVIVLFLSALMIIKGRDTPRPAEWAAASSLMLFGLSQAVAVGMALMQGAAGDDAYRAMFVHYSFLTLPAGFVAVSMFVILMLASDLSEEMTEIAIRDQLTGLLNRRGFGELATLAYATSRRTEVPVSVIMSDIDRFKNINDEFGHAAGDNALCHFASLLTEHRRTEDILARIGGEEFALILPGTRLADAMDIADDLRIKVESNPMLVESSNVRMTASFGVATLSANDTCLSDAIIRADRALYRSKRAGRNRVDLESSQLMLALDGTLKPISA